MQSLGDVSSMPRLPETPCGDAQIDDMGASSALVVA